MSGGAAIPASGRTSRHAAILAAAAVLFGAAWLLLASGAPLHTALHDGSGFGANVGLWFLMMVAMMLPAAAPWMVTFGEVAGDAFPGRRPGPIVAQFTCGYFVVWLVYGIAGAVAQQGLLRSSLLDNSLRVGTTLGGMLLIVAGVFQFTPLKDACLKHCRNPLSFFLTHWDGRRSGPFRMGARHGMWCVGCCWALMALAFVLGVMNLLWMAAITAIVVAEQWVPAGTRFRQVLGFGLALWGVALIVS